LCLGMINKKTHHIKQPRHPADYKDDMYGEYVLVHFLFMSLRGTKQSRSSVFDEIASFLAMTII